MGTKVIFLRKQRNKDPPRRPLLLLLCYWLKNFINKAGYLSVDPSHPDINGLATVEDLWKLVRV